MQASSQGWQSEIAIRMEQQHITSRGWRRASGTRQAVLSRTQQRALAGVWARNAGRDGVPDVVVDRVVAVAAVEEKVVAVGRPDDGGCFD